MNTLDSITLAGAKMLAEDIKDRLIQKLYFSLPLEEQRRIAVEVLKEMSCSENKFPNCGKKLDEVEK